MFPRRLMSEPSWARKTCEQAAHLIPARYADMQLQCGYSTTSALLTTYEAPLQCKATQQDGVIPLTMHNTAGRQDQMYSKPLKASFATSSR
jgi:hypothetical protein